MSQHKGCTIGTTDYAFILQIDVYPLDINWPQIIADIAERGVVPGRQAISLGKERSTLQRWKSGHEPKFGNGHSLLILHSKVCGIELTTQRMKEASQRL